MEITSRLFKCVMSLKQNDISVTEYPRGFRNHDRLKYKHCSKGCFSGCSFESPPCSPLSFLLPVLDNVGWMFCSSDFKFVFFKDDILLFLRLADRPTDIRTRLTDITDRPTFVAADVCPSFSPFDSLSISFVVGKQSREAKSLMFKNGSSCRFEGYKNVDSKKIYQH